MASSSPDRTRTFASFQAGLPAQFPPTRLFNLSDPVCSVGKHLSAVGLAMHMTNTQMQTDGQPSPKQLKERSGDGPPAQSH